MSRNLVIGLVVAIGLLGAWWFVGMPGTNGAETVPEPAPSASGDTESSQTVDPAFPDQNIDVTEPMALWAACANRAYQAERKGDQFDEAAFAASWAACGAERQAIIDLFPASEHAAWEERLRGIHDSIRNSAIAEQTAKPGYGLNPNDPVHIGGLSAASNEGPARIVGYLLRLRGPNGESTSYERIGSCCTFRTSNPVYGNQGRLDMYEVTYEGQDEPVIVYFNTYNEQPLGVVAGFTQIN